MGLMTLCDLFPPELTLRATICYEIWVTLEFQGHYTIFPFVVTSSDCKRHIFLCIVLRSRLETITMLPGEIIRKLGTVTYYSRYTGTR